jgi:small subunit ribosomal protein S20
MANTKQAKKRIKIARKNTEQNKRYKTLTKNSKKNLIKKIEDNAIKVVSEAFQHAQKTIDKAMAKGVLHKNKGSRDKSRLQALMNAKQK